MHPDFIAICDSLENGSNMASLLDNPNINIVPENSPYIFDR